MFSRLKSMASEQAAAFSAEYEATAAAAADEQQPPPQEQEQEKQQQQQQQQQPPPQEAPAAGKEAPTDQQPTKQPAPARSEEPVPAPAPAPAGTGWMSRVKSGAAAASASVYEAAAAVAASDPAAAAEAPAPTGGSGWKMTSSLNKVKTFIPASVESFRTEHEVVAAQAAQHPPADSSGARPPWEALTDAELPFAAEIKAACAELAKSSLDSRERREQIFMTAPPSVRSFDSHETLAAGDTTCSLCPFECGNSRAEIVEHSCSLSFSPTLTQSCCGCGCSAACIACN
jgi:hypothetical protein